MPAHVRSEVTGGLVSAAVTIPLAMGYGVFAFVAMGPEYFAHGAFAGLLTAALVGISCLALGDKSAHIYSPRVITTFFIGLLLYGLLRSDAPALRSGGVGVVLTVIFTIMLLAGLFQALFGLARLGTVIKLIPQPVMSGFQNAAALILFLVQIGNVLGFDESPSFLQALANAAHARPLSVLVAVIAAVATWQARRLLPKVPPVIVGLAAGTLLYYLLRVAGLGGHLGTTIGTMPLLSVHLPEVPQFAGLARTPGVVALLPTIVGGALALAVIASIDALLCTKLLARPGDPRIDGDRLLLRLGLANTLSAGLGGITGGLNIGPSRANRAFGGRTPLSVAVNAGALLVLLILLFPIASLLPRAALSGVIMVIAVQHIDPWTMQLVRRVASRSATPAMALDLAVIGLVAVLSLAVDIVVAVLLGLAIAALLFVVRMSRSVIRRLYRCTMVRSRKSRPRAELDLLEKSGATILAIELQGALFFGSADRLAAEIAAQVREPTRTVIVDLRRITEIDSTGARILLEINSELNRAGKWLVLSAAHPGDAIGQQLERGRRDRPRQSVPRYRPRHRVGGRRAAALRRGARHPTIGGALRRDGRRGRPQRSRRGRGRAARRARRIPAGTRHLPRGRAGERFLHRCEGLRERAPASLGRQRRPADELRAGHRLRRARVPRRRHALGDGHERHRARLLCAEPQGPRVPRRAGARDGDEAGQQSGIRARPAAARRQPHDPHARRLVSGTRAAPAPSRTGSRRRVRRRAPRRGPPDNRR